MKKISRFLNEVVAYLVAFGAFGLFAIAFLDSLLIPLPGGADAVMILLSTANPSRMPLYAFAAASGSTLGCIGLYLISQRAGATALERFSPEKRQRVRALIERYDVLSVLVASLLPPPFPFKLFVVTAGVFRFKLRRFALAVAAGRMFRFTLEGVFAIRFGKRAMEVFQRNYPVIGLSLAAVMLLFFVGKSLLKRKR